MNTIEIRKMIKSGKLEINSLSDDIKEFLSQEYSRLLNIKILSMEEFEELENLLMIYLNYYTYSENGDVLISDRMYDILMNHYIENGGSLISHSDNLVNQTQWSFVQHVMPGMVGSVRKIYEFGDLVTYMNKFRIASGVREWRMAPKFDGNSSAVCVDSNCRIRLGVTRNDGIQGQDITRVIQNAKNAKELASYGKNLKNGQVMWHKTEVVVTSEDFEELIKIKHYENRRSAAAGILNTPKNLDLARFLTVIPLAQYYPSNDEIVYEPLDSGIIKSNDPYVVMKKINQMLSIIRDASYPIRTDGVILYPVGDDILPNFNDIMDNAIAFKVNTEEALTTIDYGYVSVGKLGYAIPMLHVHPVEVNETTVRDISLGSFDKFDQMDLHEGEQVVVFSAGNVIPQAKVPEERYYKVGAAILEIKKVCPFCGKKLTRYKATYKCENTECPRVKTGKISNFVIKLGAENVADATISDLVQKGLVETIPDLFSLTIQDIEPLDGYGYDSAKIIVNELNRLQTKPTSISEFLGALGIDGISEKKCRKIMAVMPFEKMLKMKRHELEFELLDGEGVGTKTAQIFTDFIKDNKDLIKELLKIMNIVSDVKYKGNVVFTGTRDKELMEKFKKIHYDVSNNVNDKTVVVIDSSYLHDSTKCREAKRRGIDIIHISEVDEVLKELSR